MPQYDTREKMERQIFNKGILCLNKMQILDNSFGDSAKDKWRDKMYYYYIYNTTTTKKNIHKSIKSKNYASIF